MSNVVSPIAQYPALSAASESETIPEIGVADTLAALFGIFLPTVAKGVIMRRPAMLAIAEALDLDRRAIRGMQRIRDKYGSAPVRLRIPGRSFAVVLDPQDVHRVLAESPDPFATATLEKTATLAHFEPKNVLISRGAERADRRHYNEQVLEAHRPIHQMADQFVRIVESEAARLRADAWKQNRILNWKIFSDAWFRIVRRIIFGDAASEDNELSSTMAKLRYRANWAYLLPQRRALREELLTRIKTYMQRAEPNSLAGMMAHIPVTGQTAPEHQVPQWLFAFDAPGMTTFRSLALLASHPEQARAARQEIAARHSTQAQLLPFLRATVLESLRLWPTSPLILRESNSPTLWRNGVMPAKSSLIIFSPFFHRDDERLPFANNFAPKLWMGNPPNQQTSALIPFSEGPATCPGRELVLLLTTMMISELLSGTKVRLENRERLAPGKPLPATLNHFRLRFELK
ncbi:MAG TPA: cytochrome P450 [Bryobacteraceae bacterium]|jgi:cytochrome P450|nr:cytochrome P450 [Bryobacteraceae bacterium]